MFALQAGDLVLVKGKGWLSGAIRWCTQARGESKSRVSHGGLGTRPNFITEALHKVVGRDFTKSYRGATFTVYRPMTIPPADIAAICAEMESRIGEGYAYAEIGLQAADGLLSKVLGGDVYLFRRLGKLRRQTICTPHIAIVFSSRGYDFGKPPGAATPDDLDDYCRSHPDKYAVAWPEDGGTDPTKWPG